MSTRDQIEYWNHMLVEWINQEDCILDVVEHKQKLLLFLSDILKKIQPCSIGKILKLHGFVKLISSATSINAVVVLASEILVEILGTVLQAPLQNNNKPDDYELRGRRWVVSVLHSLFPSSSNLQGTELAAELGFMGAKLQTAYIQELSASLADRLSTLPSHFHHSSTSQKPISSSLLSPFTRPSPFPLQKLSRLCLIVLDNPALLQVVEHLQPGLTPASQLEPVFVREVTKGQSNGVLSRLSQASKSALWVNSKSTFSLLAQTLLDVTKQIFISDASLETLIQDSGICHVVMHHPATYSHFLRFIETSWLDTPAFSTLRLLRRTHACVMRHRSTFEQSLPTSGYFAPYLGIFVATLGSTASSREVLCLEGDAKRINEERKRILEEDRSLCTQVWLTMFCFVEWTCRAVEAILFAQDKSSVRELVDEQVASEALTDALLACKAPRGENSDGRANKRAKLWEPKSKSDLGEVLESVFKLPLPHELSLQVISNVLPGFEASAAQVKHLIHFTRAKNQDTSTAQGDAFGLQLMENILKSKPSRLDITQEIYKQLESIAQKYRNTAHEKVVLDRVTEAKALCRNK